LIYSGGISNESLGNQFLSPEYFKELTVFMSELGKTLEPLSVNLNEQGVIEIKSENGSRILFNQNDSLEKVFQNIQTLLSDKEFPPLDSLDYVDLRYGNKVFYKKSEVSE